MSRESGRSVSTRLTAYKTTSQLKGWIWTSVSWVLYPALSATISPLPGAVLISRNVLSEY